MSMLRWTTGPVCGVNNCTSRRWRIIDGQNVCRNGHVREGDVEFAADDYDNLGRSFRATRSQMIGSSQAGDGLMENGNEVSRGEQLKAEHQAYVYILKIQAEYLVKEKGVPSELMHVARALMGLWLDYIQSFREKTDFVDSSGIDSSGIEISDSESETDSGESCVELDSCKSKSIDFLYPKSFTEKKPVKTRIKNSRYSRIYPYKLNSVPPFRNSILWPTAIIYISTCIIQYPLYTSDLLRWMSLNELPVQKGIYLLPAKLIKKLPVDFRTHYFRPSTGPFDDQLMYHVGQVGVIMRTEYNYPVPNLSLNELIFKLIYMLFLPPELYPITIRFLEIFQIETDITFRDASTTAAIDDRFIYAIIIFLAKLVYGFDHTIRHPKPAEPGTEIVDWELWLSLIRRSWIDTDNFSNKDPNDVLFWNTEKLERCLDWAEEMLYTPEGHIINEHKRRGPINRFVRKTFPAKDYLDEETGKAIRAEEQLEKMKQKDLIGESILYTQPQKVSKKSKKKKKKETLGYENFSESQQSQSQFGFSQLESSQYSQYSQSLSQAEEASEKELDSEQELEINGVKTQKLPDLHSVVDKDLFSESNQNVVNSEARQDKSGSLKRLLSSVNDTSDSDSNDADESGSDSSSDSDSDSDSDSSTDSLANNRKSTTKDSMELGSDSDYETFYEDFNGRIAREGENDLENEIKNGGSSRMKPIQPTDHNLLELNQLVQSTTMPYDLQLTKFTDAVNEKRQGDWKQENTAYDELEELADEKCSSLVLNGSSGNVCEKNHNNNTSSSKGESDWEDIDAATSEYEEYNNENPNETYTNESFEDALLYPGDYRDRPQKLNTKNSRLSLKASAEYHHNKFMAQHARDYGDNNSLKNITKYPEYVHSNRIIDPVESARMDLRNTRYMGRRLRPGHRFVLNKCIDSKDNELVQALIDAAPAVIGASSRRIEEFLNRIEALVLKPDTKKGVPLNDRKRDMYN